MKRRNLPQSCRRIVITGLGLTAGMLAACAPAAPAQPPATGARPAEQAAAPAAAAQPQRGGVFLHAAKAAPPNLHPLKGTGTDQRRAMGPATEPLLGFDAEPGKVWNAVRQLAPGLAERWEQPNDTTYLFKIRQGVKWHDGADFTAADVVFSYEYLRDPANKLANASRIASADRIEVVDPYTVRITSRAPSPYLLEAFGEADLAMVPKHVADRGGNFDKELIGTGPFQLVSSDLTKDNVFKRFDGYWQAGRPYLDGVRIIFNLDKSAQAAAFIAGQNDLLEIADQNELQPISRAVPAMKYEAAVGAYGNAVYMKLDEPPYNDIRVRRAIHLGLDRQQMNQILNQGKGVINPPAIPGNLDGWAMPQEELLKLPGYRQPKAADIAEAKRLLAEAGYASGIKMTMLYSKQFATAPRIAEVFANQMRAIGVDVVLDGYDSATYKVKDEKGEYTANMAFAGNFEPYRTAYGRTHSKGSQNGAGINDPEADRLLDTVVLTMDEKVRKKAALDLQRLLLDKMYYVPTIELATYQAWQAWVKDIRVASDYVSWSLDAENRPAIVWLDPELLPAGRR